MEYGSNQLAILTYLFLGRKKDFFINVYYNFVRNTCQLLASNVKERSDRKKESDKEIALSGTENVHRTNYLGEFMKEDNKYIYVF